MNANIVILVKFGTDFAGNPAIFQYFTNVCSIKTGKKFIPSEKNASVECANVENFGAEKRRIMKRNGISVVIATIITAGLLAGCGNDTKESSVPSKSNGGKTPTSADGSVSEDKGGGGNGNAVVPPGNLTLLSRLLDYDAEGNPNGRTEYEYDAFGNMVHRKQINKNEIPTYEETWSYDGSGNLLLNTTAWYDSEGSYNYGTENVYDTSGNEIRNMEYGQGKELIVGTEQEYNADGNIAKIMHYYKDEKVTRWEEYEYDAAGNLKRMCYYDESGQPLRVCEYDTSGNLVKDSIYKPDGTVRDWHEYEYDEFGYVTRDSQYLEDGKLYHEQIYDGLYDDFGKLLSYATYDSYGNMIVLEDYDYDSLGNVTSYLKFDFYGNIWEWTEAEYDSEGNLRKEIRHEIIDEGIALLIEYDAAGNMTKYYTRMLWNDGDNWEESVKWEESAYNDQGKKTKTTNFNPDGSVIEWNEYEYDTSGNEIQFTVYDASGTVKSRYIYEYDDLGNCLKSSKYDGDGISKGWTEYEYIHVGG